VHGLSLSSRNNTRERATLPPLSLSLSLSLRDGLLITERNRVRALSKFLEVDGEAARDNVTPPAESRDLPPCPRSDN